MNHLHPADLFPGAWEFAAWRSMASGLSSPPRTPQSERSYLHPLLATRNGRRVETASGWTRVRKAYLEAFLWFVGDLPSLQAPVYHVKASGEIESGVLQAEETIAVRWLKLENPKAILLTCDDFQPIQENASLFKQQNLSVFHFERIGSGKRVVSDWNASLQSSPFQSLAGKLAHDYGLAFAALKSLASGVPVFVYARQASALGALVFAALQPELSGLAAVDPFLLLREDRHAERWFLRSPLLPRLGVLRSLSEAPFDFHHLFSFLAPRPLFTAFTPDHRSASTVSLQNQLKELYNLWDQEQNVMLSLPDEVPLSVVADWVLGRLQA